MIEIGRTGGVTSLYVERSGPTVAGLSFRVGVADEGLPLRGITHLVEHLALFEAGITDYHANGTTGGTVTSFYVTGADDRVRTFLDLVVRSLRSLPLTRLEAERGVLRTEEQRRSSPPELGIWRHGAQGYGVGGYPEWGVPIVTGEQVQGWADDWFTADNACLWVSGERRLDVDLDLPAGSWRPPPASETVLPFLPCSISAGRRAVVLDAEVGRSTAASVLARLLERELYRRLRTDGALSYAVEVGYEPLSSHRASLVAYADALEDNEDALVGELVDTLAALEAHGFRADDLETVRTNVREALDHGDFDAARLRGAAIDVLFGAKVRSREQLLAELDAVTLDDVATVAAEMRASLLLQVPWGTRADWGGFPEAPAFSTTTVSGPRYPGAGGDVLYVGPDGVSLVRDGQSLTVLYRRAAALLVWPDGALMLIGDDGISVALEPTLHPVPRDKMAWVHDRVPAARRILRPARDPEQIPRPRVDGPEPTPGRRRRGLRRR